MRLLAVDLDGTLLDPQGRAHARDAQAVRAALAAGVRVTIITGRLYSGTRRFAEELGLRGAVACADGAHLVDAGSHATLFHHGVQGDRTRLLRAAFERHRPATFVFARDAIGHDAAGVPYVDYVATWSQDVRPAEDVFGHGLWESQEGVTAVVAVAGREVIDRVIEDLARDLPGALMVASFPMRRGAHAGSWAMIVRAAGRSKGTALEWIAEREGVPLHETVCVGDWNNDLPMFRVAGRAFAMSHAPAELKAVATDVLEHTPDGGGGVAAAIERAFGIVPRKA